MCNRYSILSKPEALRQAFNADRVIYTRGGYILPAPFFPSSTVPVIRQSPDIRELVDVPWGIPKGPHLATNARDDKVATTWRWYMHRRVVFPISQAIEPHYPQRSLYGEAIGKCQWWALSSATTPLLAVAGIAEFNFTGVAMFTTKGIGRYAEIHNKKPDDPRMPVFLTSQGEIDAWLDPDVGYEDARLLLKPPAEDFDLHAAPLPAEAS